MSLSKRIEALERLQGLDSDGLILEQRVARLEANDVSNLSDEEIDRRLAELFMLATKRQQEGQGDEPIETD